MELYGWCWGREGGIRCGLIVSHDCIGGVVVEKDFYLLFGDGIGYWKRICLLLCVCFSVQRWLDWGGIVFGLTIDGWWWSSSVKVVSPSMAKKLTAASFLVSLGLPSNFLNGSGI